MTDRVVINVGVLAICAFIRWVAKKLFISSFSIMTDISIRVFICEDSLDSLLAICALIR